MGKYTAVLKKEVHDVMDNLAYGTLVGDTTTYVPTATATDNTAYANIDTATIQLEIERQRHEAQMAMLQAELQAMHHTPFEETDEFRDFVVWLCGFTDRKSPPDKKDWDGLRERAKTVAAKFALQARDRARDRHREAEIRPYQQPLFTTTGAASATMGNLATSTTAGSAAATGTISK